MPNTHVNEVAHCQGLQQQREADKQVKQQACSQIILTSNSRITSQLVRVILAQRLCSNHGGCRARGVVVSHPLSMREALGSIPSVSRCHYHSNVGRWSPTGSHNVMRWICMCQALLREMLASSTCARPLAGQAPTTQNGNRGRQEVFSPLPGPA